MTYNLPKNIRRTLKELKHTKLKDITFQEIYAILVDQDTRCKLSLNFGALRRNWIDKGLPDLDKAWIKSKKEEINK